MKFVLVSTKFTPAGADEHPLTGCRVGDGPIVMNESGVKGHTVHIESHRWELDTERKVVPLAVTHLWAGEHGVKVKQKKKKGKISRKSRILILFHLTEAAKSDSENKAERLRGD